MNNNISLVVNIAGSDSRYASKILKHLSHQHSSLIEKIIILDTLRPQTTSFDISRLNLEEYQSNLIQIKKIANDLVKEGFYDKVILTGEFGNLNILYNKYFGKLRPFSQTHDFRGAPIAAYIIGCEAVKTRYMVRYDGDILLHQDQSGDWALAAIPYFEQYEDVLSISPKTVPVLDGIGRKNEKHCWFSTRCMMVDMEKFNKQLPMLSFSFTLQILLRKLLDKSFPQAFENIIHQMMIQKKLTSLYLIEHPAYIIHPEEKGSQFVDQLSLIIKAVENNDLPEDQLKHESVQIEAWSKKNSKETL